VARLSVIIITHNEEINLRRCLESVKFADEIILNDSGSTDETLAIALEFNCKTVTSQFAGFGLAKQKALDLATGEWVLSIDADEEIDEELKRHINTAIASSDCDGYLLNRKSQFLGRWITHSGWYPDRILRLFKRSAAKFTDSRVHEKVVVTGRVENLSGHILHYTDPNISHYLIKLDRYTTLSAQMLHADGKPFHWWYLILKPMAIWVKMYILKRGFLDGMPGFILAGLSAFHVYCKYAKLWELRKS
jgi:glycosyltransferase involved in cell wall biosynthesis